MKLRYWITTMWGLPTRKRSRAVVAQAAEREERLAPLLPYFPPVPLRPGCDPVQPCGIRFDGDADRAYEVICVRHARTTGKHHRQQSDPGEPIILASVTDVAPRGQRVRQS